MDVFFTQVILFSRWQADAQKCLAELSSAEGERVHAAHQAIAHQFHVLGQLATEGVWFFLRYGLGAGRSGVLWRGVDEPKPAIPSHVHHALCVSVRTRDGSIRKLVIVEQVQGVILKRVALKSRTTVSQDVLTRSSVQLAFAKFLSKIKGNF